MTRKATFLKLGLGALASAVLGWVTILADAASVCPTPSFVSVQGSELRTGSQRFRVKGSNFVAMRYLLSQPDPHATVHLDPGDSRCSVDVGQTTPGSCEMLVFLEMWGPKFDSDGIEQEMAAYKQLFGINTIRIHTPSEPTLGQDVPTRLIPLVHYWGWQPWFNADGTITSAYASKMDAVLAAAARQQLRVYVVLLGDLALDARQRGSGWADEAAPSSLDLPQPLTLRQFYRNYVTDMGTRFRDDPTILSWEIGAEQMLGTDYTRPSPWWQAEMIDLLGDVIGALRRADPNHLVTSGEVATAAPAPPPGNPDYWHYPTAELAQVPMPAGGTRRLADLMDFLSPHFYDFDRWYNWIDDGVAFDPVQNRPFAQSLADLRAATDLPIVMGEMGYRLNISPALWGVTDKSKYATGSGSDPSVPANQQYLYFKSALDNVRARNLDGLMPWWPLPAFDLVTGPPQNGEWTGNYCRVAHSNTGTGYETWQHLFLFDDVGVCPPARARTREILGYEDYWELAYRPPGAAALQLLPAGKLFRQALRGRFDFAADGTDDVAVYRRSSGEWLVKDGCTFTPAAGDPAAIPVAADYDGNGRTDAAVFMPATGEWLIEGQAPVILGAAGDVPVPADYDGDGADDVAVFRRSTATWSINGQGSLSFGSPGGVPAPADYDGDGRVDLAVFRPTTGEWLIQGRPTVVFGARGDIPVPGDYDGDGQADVAVYRAATGTWHVKDQLDVGFGAAGNLPIPADYDGDSLTDIAVYDPESNLWSVRDGATTGFGQSGDLPASQVPQWHDAQFVSQSVPTVMVAGHSYGVSVTFRNAGSRVWLPLGNVCHSHRLISANPWGGSTWGLSRVDSLPAAGVAPGQDVTLAFNVTAPTPGKYAFQWRMIQECVEGFGDASPSVSITVRTGAEKDAQVLVQSVPPTMVAGNRYKVSLTLQNVGTAAWKPGAKCTAFRLGSANPYDNVTWGASRAELPGVVPAGAQVRVEFFVTAPAAAGIYNFQWRMLQECVAWFGDLGPNASIAVRAAAGAKDAQILSQNVPGHMLAGHEYAVGFKVKNVGTATAWSLIGAQCNAFRLGAADATWGYIRAELPNVVALGEEVNIDFRVIAPPTPGAYHFQWRMVHECAEWFGDVSANVAIVVDRW